jgi:hypothetical protein
VAETLPKQLMEALKEKTRKKVMMTEENQHQRTLRSFARKRSYEEKNGCPETGLRRGLRGGKASLLAAALAASTVLSIASHAKASGGLGKSRADLMMLSGAGRPTKAIRPGKPKQIRSGKMKSQPTWPQPGPAIMTDGAYR